MRFLRVLQMVGWGLLLLSIPFVIFDSGARPSLYRLGIGIGIGALIGVGCGLVFRLLLPLEAPASVLPVTKPAAGAEVRAARAV